MRTVAILGAVLAPLWLFAVERVQAEEPPGCNLAGTSVLMTQSPATTVQHGDTICYTVCYGAPSFPSCNITEFRADLFLPDGSAIEVVSEATIEVGTTFCCGFDFNDPADPRCNTALTVDDYCYVVNHADEVTSFTGCPPVETGDLGRVVAFTLGDGVAQTPATDKVSPCATANNDVAHCGDGVVNQDEESCDGADLGDTVCGSCRDDCTCCGDGVVDDDESCDDGNDVDDDPCRNDCTATECRIDSDCDDQDACTMDLCVAGLCENSDIVCEDGNDCTVDSCDPSIGCVFDPDCMTDSDCSDGNECTAYSCLDSCCVYEDIDCDDEDACTDDGCDPGTGCVHAPVSCDDQDNCTIDSCSADTGCSNIVDCTKCRAIDLLKEVRTLPDGMFAPQLDVSEIPPDSLQAIEYRFTVTNYGDLPEQVNLEDLFLCQDVNDTPGVAFVVGECEPCADLPPGEPAIIVDTIPAGEARVYTCHVLFESQRALCDFVGVGGEPPQHSECDPGRGDLDRDGDTDLSDARAFLSCVGGPGSAELQSECEPTDFAEADLDSDNDVDLRDFAGFARFITQSDDLCYSNCARATADGANLSAICPVVVPIVVESFASVCAFCEPLSGACCHGATGLCEDDVPPGDCEGPGDVWFDSELCDELEPPCEPARGACCRGMTGLCEDDVLSGDCAGDRDSWFELELCSDVEPCEQVGGACCDRKPLTGGCTDDVLPSDCVCDTCDWFADTPCTQIDCPPASIPTVSEWGLVIMTLLLLTSAKIYFGRRLGVSLNLPE